MRIAMRFRYLVAPFPGVLLPAVVLGIVVWTVQGGKQTRMEMYADPDEAMEAVGLQQ